NAGMREEQSPEDWWKACLLTLRELVRQAKNDMDLSTIKAISVTSTSGTVIPLDSGNRPLHAALMYSDKRSGAEAVECREAAIGAGQDGFIAFNYSCGLPKMRWFA